MGYRVGFQCFDTINAATDYQMSLVVPSITADGAMVHPIKQGETWTYAGQPVSLSFATCDPMQDYKQGLELGMVLVGLFALAWGFRFLSRYVYDMSRNIAGNDES